MKTIIALGLLILLVSCATTDNQVAELDTDKAYLGVYLKDNYIIKLENLDTNEELVYELKKRDGLTVFALPSGSYAVKEIKYDGGFWGPKLSLHVPLFVKTIINTEVNNLVFLGDFHTTTESKGNATYYTLNYDYSWDEALQDIEIGYYRSNDFSVNYLEMMSLENKEESKFDFDM